MSILYTNDYIGAAKRLRAMPLAFLAVLALGACHRQAPSDVAPAIVLASPVHAHRGISAGENVRYPVEAAARYSNAMSFRVAGKLLERRVPLGDSVRKGQA